MKTIKEFGADFGRAFAESERINLTALPVPERTATLNLMRSDRAELRNALKDTTATPAVQAFTTGFLKGLEDDGG